LVSELVCQDVSLVCIISGFRRDAGDICALLGYYAALSGSSVPTFRDNLSVPSLKVKKSQEVSPVIGFSVGWLIGLLFGEEFV
jgi:hypothetical protein